MAQKTKKLFIRLVLLLAIFCLGWGYWIPAKALLAQFLLEGAWEISKTSKQPVVPWPWADTYPVGRLKLERLKVDLIVLEGGAGESLAFGPGRLEQSGQVGGEEHVVLAGHRDTSFSFLRDLRHGDTLLLESLKGEELYKVLETGIVEASELYLDRQLNTLSLVTCYPFEALLPGTPLRYIVTAVSH